MIQSTSSFGRLPKGPAFIQAFEGNISDPVVGSRQELNDSTTGSPFTIQVLLPDILTTSFTGGGVSVPKGIFDPFLEELNIQNSLTGQDELGTRASSASNIGIVDAALKSNNNFQKVLTRQQKFRESSFVSTNEGLQNLRDIVYGNGLRIDPTSVGSSTANQTAGSDLTQALSVILQANDILQAPIFQLLINPTSLSVTYGKNIDYSARVRGGYVVQAWQDHQVKLALEGKIGSFIASSRDGGSESQTFTVSGYQWQSRQDSAAFQNLQNLFQIYRNNAQIYDLIGGTEAHLWTGNIAINFDQKMYLGNFESFNYSFDEAHPNGGLSYSLNFVVSEEYDTQSPGPILPIGGPGFESVLGSSQTSIQNTKSASSETLLNPLF